MRRGSNCRKRRLSTKAVGSIPAFQVKPLGTQERMPRRWRPWGYMIVRRLHCRTAVTVSYGSYLIPRLRGCSRGKGRDPPVVQRTPNSRGPKLIQEVPRNTEGKGGSIKGAHGLEQAPNLSNHRRAPLAVGAIAEAFFGEILKAVVQPPIQPCSRNAATPPALTGWVSPLKQGNPAPLRPSEGCTQEGARHPTPVC